MPNNISGFMDEVVKAIAAIFGLSIIIHMALSATLVMLSIRLSKSIKEWVK